mmetsp:Transcript_16037/g.55760  ORF Transcript_16037/g.55760 Transcript_16037/m.55760 type:complete len:401 (-) Transcript_16037:265-1467(-)
MLTGGPSPNVPNTYNPFSATSPDRYCRRRGLTPRSPFFECSAMAGCAANSSSQSNPAHEPPNRKHTSEPNRKARCSKNSSPLIWFFVPFFLDTVAAYFPLTASTTRLSILSSVLSTSGRGPVLEASKLTRRPPSAGSSFETLHSAFSSSPSSFSASFTGSNTCMSERNCSTALQSSPSPSRRHSPPPSQHSSTPPSCAMPRRLRPLARSTNSTCAACTWRRPSSAPPTQTRPPSTTTQGASISGSRTAQAPSSVAVSGTLKRPPVYERDARKRASFACPDSMKKPSSSSPVPLNVQLGAPSIFRALTAPDGRTSLQSPGTKVSGHFSASRQAPSSNSVVPRRVSASKCSSLRLCQPSEPSDRRTQKGRASGGTRWTTRTTSPRRPDAPSSTRTPRVQGSS